MVHVDLLVKKSLHPGILNNVYLICQIKNKTGSGVARPVTMWKHKIGARGLGAAEGPQWVQGKALVGGAGE